MKQEHLSIHESHTPHSCAFSPRRKMSPWKKKGGKQQAITSECQEPVIWGHSYPFSLSSQSGVNFTTPLCLAAGVLPTAVCKGEGCQTLMIVASACICGQFRPFCGTGLRINCYFPVCKFTLSFLYFLHFSLILAVVLQSQSCCLLNYSVFKWFLLVILLPKW